MLGSTITSSTRELGKDMNILSYILRCSINSASTIDTKHAIPFDKYVMVAELESTQILFSGVRWTDKTGFILLDEGHEKNIRWYLEI